MYEARRLIFLVLSLIAAFFVFMAISFYVYPVFNPDAEFETDPVEIGEFGFNTIDYTEFGPEVVARLKNERDELQRRLDQTLGNEIKLESKTDSLLAVLAELERQVNLKDMQLTQFAAEQEVGKEALNEKIKAMFSLEVDQLAPITMALSDNLLFDIYISSSNIQREILLQSLEPRRAANLLRKVSS